MESLNWADFDFDFQDNPQRLDNNQLVGSISGGLNDLSNYIKSIEQNILNVSSNKHTKSQIIQDIGHKSALFKNLRHNVLLQLMSAAFNKEQFGSFSPVYYNISDSITFRDTFNLQDSGIQDTSLDMKPDALMTFGDNAKTYSNLSSIIELKVTDLDTDESNYETQLARYRSVMQKYYRDCNHMLFLIVAVVRPEGIIFKNYIQKFTSPRAHRKYLYPDFRSVGTVLATDFSILIADRLKDAKEYNELYELYHRLCLRFQKLDRQHNYHREPSYLYGSKLGPMLDTDLFYHFRDIQSWLDLCNIHTAKGTQLATILEFLGEMPDKTLLYLLLNIYFEHKGPQNYFDRRSESRDFIKGVFDMFKDSIAYKDKPSRILSLLSLTETQLFDALNNIANNNVTLEHLEHMYKYYSNQVYSDQLLILESDEDIKHFTSITVDDIDHAYKSIETEVPETRQCVHVADTKPSIHFLITNPSNFSNNLIPVEQGSLLDINLLKKYKVFKPGDHDLVIKQSKKSHIQNVCTTSKLWQALDKNVEKIANSLFFGNKAVFQDIVEVTKDMLHETPEYVAQLLHNTNLPFYFYDEKTSMGLQGVHSLLTSFFQCNSDIKKSATVGIIIDRLFRERVDPDGSMLLDHELKEIRKEQKKERNSMFQHDDGYENFTGYTNTFRLPTNTTQGNHTNSKIKSLLTVMGKGKKSVDDNKYEAAISALQKLISPGDSDIVKKQKISDQLQTKRKVIDPNCTKCNDFCAYQYGINLDLDKAPSNMDDIITLINQYYLTSTMLQEDTAGVKLSNVMADEIRTLVNEPLSKSLYSTQLLFKKLLVKMNTFPNQKTYSVISGDEQGRFFLIPPQSDPNHNYITYIDVKFSTVERSNHAELTKLFYNNFDNTMFQFYSDGILLQVSKPFKLDLIRVDVLSKLFYRYSLCQAGFSSLPTRFMVNHHSRRNCLSIASNITMSKLGLFDLSRHLFNHAISSCSNFKEFMKKKFTFDNKTIYDHQMYIRIKEWLKQITSMKGLLILTDETDPGEFNSKAAALFSSYITGVNYSSFQDLINNVFGPIYFSPKALHCSATNLTRLTSVPAEFEIKFRDYVKSKSTQSSYFTKEVFEGNDDFSHNSSLLIKTQTDILNQYQPHLLRTNISTNCNLDNSITAIHTAVSSKSSVDPYDNSYAQTLLQCYSEAYKWTMQSGNAYTCALLYYNTMINKNDIVNSGFDYNQIKSHQENLLKRLKYYYVKKALPNKSITLDLLKSVSVNVDTLVDVALNTKKVTNIKLSKYLAVLTMKDFIVAKTLPVKSALYKLIKKNNLENKLSTFRELINELMDEKYFNDHLTICLMFEKGQRTKTDREIYILDLLTKYLVYPIEMCYFTLNAQDQTEAISVQGDRKKLYLKLLESRTERNKNLFTLERSTHPEYEIEKFYISVDQSKWSALDSYPKFLVSILTLHFLSLRDRLLFFQIMIRYMSKKIVIDDSVLIRLADELRHLDFNESTIIQITNHLKSNNFQATYNWCQGVFNHISSKQHSYAMHSLATVINNYLLKHDPTGQSKVTIDAMVHSDDGAIGVCAKLHPNLNLDIIQKYGTFQCFFMNKLIRHLRSFGIILNPTKTFFHETILDFISDYIVNLQPIGSYMRSLGTILSPLDHKSHNLDMKQLSGALQTIGKNSPSALQLATACYISSQFVHCTYNLDTENSLKTLLSMRDALKVESLPISLFGPISVPINLIPVTGITFNDVIILLRKISKDLASNLIENNELHSLLVSYYNVNKKYFSFTEVYQYLITGNNFTKISTDWPISEESKTLCFFINSNLDDSDATALEAISSNMHLLRMSNRRSEITSLRRVPHIKDTILSVENPDSYMDELASCIRKAYHYTSSGTKDFNSFLNNLKLQSLKPKTYTQLSTTDTTRSRINLMTDINKPVFTLQQILSSIDSNTKAATYSNQVASAVEEALIDQYYMMGVKLLKTKEQLIQNHTIKGYTMTEDDFENIDGLVRWSAQSASHLQPKNRMLNSFYKWYLEQNPGTENKKYNYHSSVKLLLSLCLYLTKAFSNADSDIVVKTCRLSIYSNIADLNFLAFTETSVKTGKQVPARPSLVECKGNYSMIRIPGDLEYHLLNSLLYDKPIIINIDTETVTLKIADLATMFNLTEYYAIALSLRDVVLYPSQNCKVFLFHYYTDLIFSAIKSYFKDIITRTHYLYLKLPATSNSEIASILKGSFTMTHDVMLYKPSKIFSPNSDLGLVQFMNKPVKELNSILVKNNLFELNHHVKNITFLTISRMLKSKTISECNVADLINRLNQNLNPILSLKFLDGYSLLDIWQSSDLQTYLKDIASYWAPLGFNLGYLSSNKLEEIISKNYVIEDWPDSETGVHQVSFAKDHLRVTLKFNNFEAIFDDVDIVAINMDRLRARKESQQLICKILSSKLKNTPNFFENVKGITHPTINADYALFQNGDVHSVSRHNVSIVSPNVKFIKGIYLDSHIRHLNTDNFSFLNPTPLSGMPGIILPLGRLNTFTPLNLFSSDENQIHLIQKFRYKQVNFSNIDFSNILDYSIEGILYYRFLNDHRQSQLRPVIERFTIKDLIKYYKGFKLDPQEPQLVYTSTDYTGVERLYKGTINLYIAEILSQAPTKIIQTFLKIYKSEAINAWAALPTVFSNNNLVNYICDEFEISDDEPQPELMDKIMSSLEIIKTLAASVITVNVTPAKRLHRLYSALYHEFIKNDILGF